MTNDTNAINFEPRFISANGLRFGYLSHGPEDGPLVLLFHGFPDTAQTWDATLRVLGDAGFHAVAPFMRGYPPTEIPPFDAFRPQDLGADVLALIDAFGAENAHIIGHDWGAFAVHTAVAMAPEKIASMVTVAIAHPLAIKPSLTLLWKARHFLTFQAKRRTARKIRRADYAFIDTIYKRWSPTWSPAASETAYVKAGYATPRAVEGSLAYYWCFAAAQRGAARAELNGLLRTKIRVPTLAFCGADDGALDPSAFERARKRYTGSYTWEMVDGAGHFLHREAPEHFITKTLAFLQA